MSEDATVPMAMEGVVGTELTAQSMLLAARRYSKLSELARGGAGRIIAARDLVFDRAVALKEPLDPVRGGARLRAEADILARLQHPSIVPVYDTGVWSDGVPFFAMKLIEGRSLRDVIHDAPELEQRIALIPQLVAVADAIAYAHSQHVIHRDLKPGNVLVGQFGETIVIDWGLAKLIRGDGVEPGEPGTPATAPPRRPAIETATGTVFGTPAYMAPEQARGEPVDERADVYALGAMLYHLLTGRAPFHDDGSDLLAAARARRPQPIEAVQPRAPADLVAIVAKAMAHDATERYPTAAELAADLRRFERGQLVIARRYSSIARLRRWLRTHRAVVLGVALAAASAGTAIVVMPSGAVHPGAQCARAGDRIRTLWDPDHRLPDRSLAVRGAWLAGGSPSAGDTFGRVDARLARYSRDWAAARVEACEATRVRGEQSDALLDLRMACLDQRSDDLEALLRAFIEPRAGVIDKAVQAAAKLPPVAACNDVRALQAALPPPADPVARATADAARRNLSTVKALATTGAYRDGLALAGTTMLEAEALGHAPVLAEALYWRSELELRTGDAKAAEASARRGLLVAADAHDDALAVRLWVHLIYTVSERLGRPADALALRTAAEAAVHRANNDPDLQARLWDVLGAALNSNGAFEEARTCGERAVALGERFATDQPELAIMMVNLSNALSSLDRNAEAQALLERAMAIFERVLGPGHPSVATVANNLGGRYFVAGDLGHALASFDRSLAIKQRTLGSEHPDLGPTLVNRGMVLGSLGRNDEAARDLERAEAIFETARGPDHRDVAHPLYQLGIVRRDQGRLDEARRDLERALAIGEHALGPSHPDLCFTLVDRKSVV